MTTYPTPSGTFGSSFEPPVSSRVSILAIMSLVLAILCFIPGAGVLAMVCGGAAILFISAGKGRLTGLGLAVAGCVIGLVTTVIWGFVVLGAASVGNQFGAMIQPVSATLTAMEKGDMAAARAEFSPTLNAAVTDQQMMAFAASYQAELGKFKQAPSSTMDIVKSYMTIGPLMQKVGNRQQVIPVPAEFEKGWAVLLLQVPNAPPTTPPPAGKPNFWMQIENMIILTATAEHELLPGGAAVTPAAPKLPGAPGEPSEPADGEAEPEPDAEPVP